ncbi:hypothetical protein [Photobacterium galatheae]|uniref:Uncharacterized protein n=1 Tax=Photobacterium galatheae TaxID=1654360 RepID=A0A066RK66_9GAMM|nr:hypothetical protein [Photobacterium galatheae]KDM90835.1 hypothetical protein EA58_13830 [Photobacterium galatheae]MCM0149197.1 hypothetical protein [Photobacterium galatheae]
MASKPRSGAGKLKQALSLFSEYPHKTPTNLSKVALKVLREAFGESLKITAQSHYAEEILTQSVTFSVNNGKYDEILAETSLTASVSSLEKMNQECLPSRTLHNLATLEALMLMGFDIEASSENLSADREQIAEPQIYSAPVPEQTQKPEAAQAEQVLESPQSPVSEPSQPDTVTEAKVELLTDEDDKQSTDEISTESENNDGPSSRSEELHALIEEQREEEEGAKLVSNTIKARIIESMRSLDLSEKAILSRLRSSQAKSIHDMTQEEGYRITSWLNKSTAHSTSIMKKREMFGGFSLHLPAAEEADEVQADKAQVKQPKSRALKGEDKSGAKQASREPSSIVTKTVNVYQKELGSNPKVEGYAIDLLKQISGKDVEGEEVVSAILELSDAGAKTFRSKLSSLILTGN